MVEAVFGYPGIGMLTYESAKTSDYNMLMVLLPFNGSSYDSSKHDCRASERKVKSIYAQEGK